MDRQIEELTNDIIKSLSTEYIYAQSEVMEHLSDIRVLVSSLISKRWRKITENEVVLTREEYELFSSVKKGFPNDTSWLAEKYSEIGQTARIRTAKKFVERLKADVSEDNELHEALNYYLKRDYFEYIDEICKELEGEDGKG